MKKAGKEREGNEENETERQDEERKKKRKVEGQRVVKRVSQRDICCFNRRVFAFFQIIITIRVQRVAIHLK